jgi:uncharacterized protein
MPNSLISCDDHMDLSYLPADLWQQRLPQKFRDAAPHMVETDNGRMWVVEDQNWGTFGRPVGRIIERAWDWVGLEDEPEPGVFRACTVKYRLEDMDRDGVGAQVLYALIPFGRIQDVELRQASIQAYNSWFKELLDESGRRLIGLPILPLTSPEDAVSELNRVAKLGFHGVYFDCWSAPKPMHDECWDPIWAAAAEADIAISLHVGGGVRTAQPGNPQRNQAHIFASAFDTQLDEPFASIVFAIADRYPRVKFILAESGLGWVAYYLHRMDRYDTKGFPREFDLSVPPSEIFRRQMYATFQDEEEGGIRRIPEIGIDNVMWASDYPHPGSTWSFSQEKVKSLDILGDEAKRKITYENVVKLYGIDVAALTGGQTAVSAGPNA